VTHTVTPVLGAYILRASSVSETFRRPWERGKGRGGERVRGRRSLARPLA